MMCSITIPTGGRLADVLTCIREKSTIDRAGRKLAVNAERYLKPPQEVSRLFRDAPESDRGNGGSQRRAFFSLDELRYEYPDEEVQGFDKCPGCADASHLRRRGRALSGWHSRQSTRQSRT
jgi:DNA polymerase III alpha subunit